MKKRDFYRQMLLQEEDKRSCGDESTADLYRAVRNPIICFTGGK